MEFNDLKKLLKFSLNEKQIIEKLQLPEDAFLPLLFSIRFGGDWSVLKNSKKVMAVKEKITRYDEKKQLGYTLERIYLFIEPKILNQEGRIHRLEKCSTKNERELVQRPYQVLVDGDYILEAILNPMDLKISLKKIHKPLKFTGSSAFGVSHEMEHLNKVESQGKPFWEFEYELK